MELAEDEPSPAWSRPRRNAFLDALAVLDNDVGIQKRIELIIGARRRGTRPSTSAAAFSVSGLEPDLRGHGWRQGQVLGLQHDDLQPRPGRCGLRHARTAAHRRGGW
jgi:hypothetical protein